MTSSTQILEDVLDWCINSTKISESVGKDKNGDQVNLIHYAAEKGYFQIVKKLVHSGIEIDSPAPNLLSKTPLRYASENDHFEVANLLLENGANVNCKDALKETPLHLASVNGHLEIAQLLLVYGANINSQSLEKETPLHLAARFGKKEIVKLLMDNGCNLNLKNSFGETAEDGASFRGFHEIAELISRKGMESLSQNLFQTSAVPFTPPRQENPNECKICFESKEESFVFIPCGHTVACEQCCRRLLGEPCPICRELVNQYNRIYL